MKDSEHALPVFNYVASIRGREFIVTIHQNMMSEWDDLGGCSLNDRLREVVPEGTVISVRVSEEIFAKALKMAEEEKLEESKGHQFQTPAAETMKDIAEMDRLFTEFFWREVNSRLRQPLIQEAA